MKLYAKIQDRESGYERVVLCTFKDKDDNDVYVEEVEHNGNTWFKVILDDGYVHTEYFYPISRYTITELKVYH